MNWRDLKVWQKAHDLVLEIYTTSAKFTSDEKFGLTSQIRRSAVSVCANIVEGQSRNTTKEYLQFLYNARGSVEETRYHLLLARDLKYLRESEYLSFESQYGEVSKMLNSLIATLKKKS